MRYKREETIEFRFDSIEAKQYAWTSSCQFVRGLALCCDQPERQTYTYMSIEPCALPIQAMTLISPLRILILELVDRSCAISSLEVV
jgi:hypothetical protein